jgi:hypothetical protein
LSVYTTRRLILLLIGSVLIGLVVVAASLPAVNYYNHLRPPNTSALKCCQIIYYFAEDSNPLFNQTVTRLGTWGVPALRLDSSQVGSNNTLRMTSRPDSFIVVSGDWISSRVNDNQTQTFLFNILGKGAKIVAIGGPTGRLFDAVINSNVGKLTSATILPQPTNWPGTGFWLKTSTTAYGATSLYPSYLGQNTTDPNALIQGWNDWLTGI